MNNPTYAHLTTIPNTPKEDPTPNPKVITLIEDLPTITHLAATHAARYTYDEHGNILSTEPVPTKDKEDPSYTKLPVRDDFAIPEMPPIPTTRFWALIAYEDTKHVIRIEYQEDPLNGVQQTKEHFALESTVVGEAAQQAARNLPGGTLPAADPDAHDDWAYRLLKGLYSDSV